VHCMSFHGIGVKPFWSMQEYHFMMLKCMYQWTIGAIKLAIRLDRTFQMGVGT
jgi:hypothetical protein